MDMANTMHLPSLLATLLLTAFTISIEKAKTGVDIEVQVAFAKNEIFRIIQEMGEQPCNARNTLYTVFGDDSLNRQLFNGAVGVHMSRWVANARGFMIGAPDVARVTDHQIFKVMTAVLFTGWYTFAEDPSFKNLRLEEVIKIQWAEATIQLFVDDRAALGLTKIGDMERFIGGAKVYLQTVSLRFGSGKDTMEVEGGGMPEVEQLLETLRMVTTLTQAFEDGGLY